MLPKKTIQEREKELQVLLADPAGRKELALLESRYSAASGRIRSQRSVHYHLHPGLRKRAQA